MALPAKAMAFSLGLALAGGHFSAQAASITLTTNDIAGSSSLFTAGHWSNSLAPSAGNTYSVGALLTLRTPNPATNPNSPAPLDMGTFGGDSLSIDAGARFIGKVGNNTATVQASMTINNLLLNGGTFDQAGNQADSSILIVNGNITVTANSTIGALGAATSANLNFETLDIFSTISGSGGLTVGGSQNNGDNTGVVRLNAANPYSGNITVAATTRSGYIASPTLKLLNLNNLNALQNATLTVSANNGVSFASAVNTGAFNISALAGNSNLVLTDTAASAVFLSIGGNNASSSYGGLFSGSGGLIKTGTGTFTTTGNSSQTGGVTISAGTFQMGAGGATGNGGQSGSSITFTADDTRLLLNRTGVLWNYNLVLGGSGSGVNILAAATGVPTSWGNGQGNISGSGTQTLQINDASNAGTITLPNNYSYTNPTTVFAGTLLVNGSISGSTVTVNNTATLGGGTAAVAGNIGPIIVKGGGKLAPGNGIGSLNAGAVSLEANSIFGLEIDSTALTTDFLLSFGDLTLAPTNNTALSVTDLTPAALAAGTSFNFISYFGVWNGGLFTVGGNVITDYDPVLRPSSTAFTVSGNLYQLDYDFGGNTVQLIAIPEPATATSLLGGLGLLAGWRRRRGARS